MFSLLILNKVFIENQAFSFAYVLSFLPVFSNISTILIILEVVRLPQFQYNLHYPSVHNLKPVF